MIWNSLVRPILFRFGAESIHHRSMSLFNTTMIPPVSTALSWMTAINDPCLEQNVFGIDFVNPIGLAAGFDKQAIWFNSLRHLGFSHIEVGTLTGQAQSGNPQPRLFRLPADSAVVNRMGFNNVGAEQAASALAKTNIKTVVGINIGKTKLVDVDKAVDDYLKSFRLLFPYAKYFTVNVSSPNTPGLRTLQDRGPLTELLTALLKENEAQAKISANGKRPILLKIAPDLNEDQITDIGNLCGELSLDGIIATNTTISRDSLKTGGTKIEQIGNGGLSGKPLTKISRNVVKRLYETTSGKLPIIGVGGIMEGEDAWQMICHGASLLQVYTGFIYGGPMFVRNLNRHLKKRVLENGFENISQAIGSAVGQR